MSGKKTKKGNSGFCNRVDVERGLTANLDDNGNVIDYKPSHQRCRVQWETPSVIVVCGCGCHTNQPVVSNARRVNCVRSLGPHLLMEVV